MSRHCFDSSNQKSANFSNFSDLCRDYKPESTVSAQAKGESNRGEDFRSALLQSSSKKVFTVEEAKTILDFSVLVYFNKFTVYKLLMNEEISTNEEKNIIVQIEKPQKIKPLNKALFQKKK